MAKITISTTDEDEWSSLVNGPWSTLFGTAEIVSSEGAKSVSFDVSSKALNATTQLIRLLTISHK